MNETWLVLDVNYLMNRAFYAVGSLSHGGDATGALFGFFRDIIQLRDLFSPDGFAFCFDKGVSKRRDSYPEYKRNRKEKPKKMDEDEWQEFKEARGELKGQIVRLREDLLPKIGFRNVLAQKGYEADDLIASVCLYSLKGRKGIIVSSDEDMYQLLTERVTIWNPRKNGMVTAASFEEEWGIRPDRWRHVKAMAGCSSDNVEGIKGIGEKTAARWQLDKLKPGSKAFERILAGNAIYQRNLPLVTLPLEGTKRFRLKEDKTTDKKWRDVMKSLGMKSIRELGV